MSSGRIKLQCVVLACKAEYSGYGPPLCDAHKTDPGIVAAHSAPINTTPLSEDRLADIEAYYILDYEEGIVRLAGRYSTNVRHSGTVIAELVTEVRRLQALLQEAAAVLRKV